MGRPVERSFVKSLIYPYTIDNRRDAIGAAWMLNFILRIYRSWYKVRTRDDGIRIKEDASTRVSHILAHSAISAPIATPRSILVAGIQGRAVVWLLASDLRSRGEELND